MLKNKIILITGASRGIGQATAILLAKHHAQVILHGRSEQSLQETVQSVRQYGVEPFTVIYDMLDNNAMKQAMLNVKKQFGRLDGLVNNAGIMEENLLGMMTVEEITKSLNINVMSVLIQTQFAMKLMKKNESSSIVNLSSIIGVEGAEGSSLYAASKAAIIGMTKSASKELAKYNIRVNAVAPGFIETVLTAHYEGEAKKHILNNIKMNRLGKPEDVAGVIMFLMSDLSAYVTGQVIGVDGGMVI